MGKRMKKAVLVLLSLFLSFAADLSDVKAEETVRVMEQESGIEQVYGNLPEVVVYGYGLEGFNEENSTAYLGSQELKWESSFPFKETGEGIYYYVLLDVSGSIPKNYFSSIKDGILKLQDELGPKDKLVLLSFGEDVKRLTDGEQSAAQLSEILVGLENKDKKTLLFEAIDRVADAVSKVGPKECSRRVIIVISDGEDIAIGKKMAQEALANLKEKGIPLYALCIKDTDRNNINSFGEFARMSGGSLVTFRADEGSNVLTELNTRLSDFLEIKFRNDSNVVSNQYEIFSLKAEDTKEVLTREIFNSRWIPDHIAPVIKDAADMGEQQLRITFSESVSGLGDSSNYFIRRGTNIIPVSSVARTGGAETEVILTLEKPLEEGTYEISCSNITDQSMEKNSLDAVYIFSNAEQKDQVEKEVSLPIKKSVQSETEDNTGIWFLIFMAVVVLIIVVCVTKKKDKEHKNEKLDFELLDKVQDSQIKKLQAVIRTDQNMPKKSEWSIKKSLIFGRSDMCDVVFNDRQMSRQHFALEWDGAVLFITDLDSKNGTFINGMKVMKKEALISGCIIKAGASEITLRW